MKLALRRLLIFLVVLTMVIPAGLASITRRRTEVRRSGQFDIRAPALGAMGFIRIRAAGDLFEVFVFDFIHELSLLRRLKY